MIAAVISFLVSVAFVPIFQGAATSPRWAVAAVSLYFVPWWALAFVGFWFWAIDFDQAVHWAILTGALFCGYRHEQRVDVASGASLGCDAVIQAFSAGMLVSGAIAGLQILGYALVPGGMASGLFVNKNVMGEAACLAFVAGVSLLHRKRAWWVWPLICAPALLLSTSRAAWIAALVGLFIAVGFRWRIVLAVMACAAAAGLWFTGREIGTESLMQRVMLWQGVLHDLGWLGSGSFDYSTIEHREPHLHNDWLQMVYEWGLVAAAPLAVVILAGVGGCPAFVAGLVVLGSFSFPLHSPASAWFAAFIIGYLLRVCVEQGGIPLFRRLALS